VAFALTVDGGTAMAERRLSSRRANVVGVVKPKVRYNAARQELNVVTHRPSAAVVTNRYVFGSLTAAHALRAEQLAADLARLAEQFTTALSDVVVWDDRSLRATFSAQSEDYDVAATEEASLAATRQFGW
jgi:hypothetical protein